MFVQRLNGYQSCKLFMCIRSHFKNEKFNLFEGSMVRYSEDNYNKRNDKACYEALSGEYAKGDLAYYFMANYLNGKNHPAEMQHTVYKEWKSKMYNLERLFEEDCKKIKSTAIKNNLTFNDFFISGNGGLPLVIQMMNGKLINMETVCIIDKILNGYIMTRMKKQVTDQFNWPNIYLKITKYSPWMDRYTNIKKLKQILVTNK